MKGYKAFDKNLKCRDFQYEIGKEFKYIGEIELCKKGFHFCKKIIDIVNYYNLKDKDIRLCEIEAKGKIIESESKCVTDCIKIVREISKEEMYLIENTGVDNLGFGNTGDRNTGDRNTGNCNTGNCNTGNWNTGDRNTGYWNTGDRNTGNWNTGDRNTGNWNTGDRNTGNCNTGYWNITDFSTGCFCTKKEQIKFFDKKTDITFADWRKSRAREIIMKIRTSVWIYYENMTDKEKENYPSAKTCNGYLKKLDLKEEATRWWNELSDEEKEIIRKIPNYNRTKFRKIMGGAKIG